MTSDPEPTKNGGLVISAKSVRKRRALANASDLSEASKRIPNSSPSEIDAEGNSHFVTLSPASIKVSKSNPSNFKRSVNYRPRTPIVRWSSKSRSNMIARFCSLDFTEMFFDDDLDPVMVTLTYPKDWEVVAPNSSVAKAHLTSFRKRPLAHAQWRGRSRRRLRVRWSPSLRPSRG